MSAHRFFLQDALPEDASYGGHAVADGPVGVDGHGVALPLSPEDVHHAVGVLRVSPGERIEVVEPSGAVWLAHVTATHGGQVSARLLGRLRPPASEPEVVLVQGLAKGDKMDDIVRHAVELGATRIVPFIAERSVVRLDDRKAAAKAERWRRIAKSAAEQAHRSRVPDIAEVTGVEGAVAATADCDRVVVLWEDASPDSPGVAQALDRAAGGGAASVALVVGPEGGLAEREVELFMRDGAVAATLGPHVLRTQTAALAALTLAVHELGGLGNHR